MNLKDRLNYLKSKTLVFFGGIGSTCWSYAPDIQAQLLTALPQLKEFLPENPFKTLGAFLIVGGILLRIATTGPLSAKTSVPSTESTK